MQQMCTQSMQARMQVIDHQSQKAALARKQHWQQHEVMSFHQVQWTAVLCHHVRVWCVRVSLCVALWPGVREHLLRLAALGTF